MEVEVTATGEKSTGAWATGTERGWAGAAGSPFLTTPHTAQAHMYLHLGLPELSTASHLLDFPHVLPFAWNAFPSHPHADSAEVPPPPGSLPSPYLMLIHITQPFREHIYELSTASQAFVPQFVNTPTGQHSSGSTCASTLPCCCTKLKAWCSPVTFTEGTLSGGAGRKTYASRLVASERV